MATLVQRLTMIMLSCLLHACITVDSISVSQIPSQKNRNHRISARASRPLVFFIPFGTGFVEEARQELLAKCPQGEIQGVLSKHQNKVYFPIVFHQFEVEMSGYCVKTKKMRHT